MTKALNEGFQAECRHQSATSPDEFIVAAEILEAGGTWQQMRDALTSQHLTSLFHVEHRPPMSMLMDLGSKEAAKLLRDEAAKIDGES